MGRVLVAAVMRSVVLAAQRRLAVLLVLALSMLAVIAVH